MRGHDMVATCLAAGVAMAVRATRVGGTPAEERILLLQHWGPASRAAIVQASMFQRMLQGQHVWIPQSRLKCQNRTQSGRHLGRAAHPAAAVLGPSLLRSHRAGKYVFTQFARPTSVDVLAMPQM